MTGESPARRRRRPPAGGRRGAAVSWCLAGPLQYSARRRADDPAARQKASVPPEIIGYRERSIGPSTGRGSVANGATATATCLALTRDRVVWASRRASAGRRCSFRWTRLLPLMPARMSWATATCPPTRPDRHTRRHPSRRCTAP